MSVHPWASDPKAQAAVRAAEDAAAAKRTPLPDHRDLPAAVAELRERVARLESAAKLAPAANAGGESNQPQPPRGWLTEEDCQALYLACAVLDGVFVGSWQEKHDAARRIVSIRERARREVGGEVE